MNPLTSRIMPGSDSTLAARAVIWDLDGTLADSEEYHWLAWQQVMADEGIAITHDQFLATFGQRNDTVLTGWLGADASEAHRDRIGETKEAAFRRLVGTRGCVALPGALDWVQRLGPSGWRQAIASSAPRANIEVMIEGLGIAGDFDAIASSEDVTVGKPDPQVFLIAASRLDVPPSRCIVVEDAAAGVEAARRAGMPSVGVRANGDALNANVFARSLAELGDTAFDRLLDGMLDEK